MKKLIILFIYCAVITFISCSSSTNKSYTNEEKQSAEKAVQDSIAAAEQAVQSAINDVAEVTKSESIQKEDLKSFEIYINNNKSKFRIKSDEMNESQKIFDISSPKYINDFSNIYCYLYKNKYLVDCLITIQYVGEDWLFIENYKIKTDSNTYDINSEEYDKIQRDNDSGEVYEWCTFGINKDRLKMLEDIATSKKVTLRINGNQYYKDRIISNKEKKAITNIVSAWKIANKS